MDSKTPLPPKYPVSRTYIIQQVKERGWEIEINPLANVEHEVCELICVKCYDRFIAAFPVTSLLKNMICANCGCAGTLIKTGQSIDQN